MGCILVESSSAVLEVPDPKLAHRLRSVGSLLVLLQQRNAK